MRKLKRISHIVMMGDSLSDRGTAERKYIFGCVPLSLFTGLRGVSPYDRFTNGYVWADRISAMFASDFLIKQIKKKYGYTNEEIAEAIITKEKRIIDALQHDYNLNCDLYVKFEGRYFIRSYDEGGLTSYNYCGKPSNSLKRFFSRLILTTLANKRKKLLAFDDEYELSPKQKEQTLLIEWSGANDLITVNARPSMIAVDRAIKERMKNIESLIKNGYRNFVLFNLPNLALSPRFQNMAGVHGEKERENASQCCIYLNQQLAAACQNLQQIYPQCCIDVFDADKVFTDVYNNPEVYFFDADKRHQPYKTSLDFKIAPNRASPATGYMFWDDIHPSADLHALLADAFYKKYNAEYHFTQPENNKDSEPEIDISTTELQKAFYTRYREKLLRDQHAFFGCMRKSRIKYKTASLDEILRHALHENGNRTRAVITELQWIDKKGKLNLNIPALKQAMYKMQLRSLITFIP